jgi:hypothetical protein
MEAGVNGAAAHAAQAVQAAAAVVERCKGMSKPILIGELYARGAADDLPSDIRKTELLERLRQAEQDHFQRNGTVYSKSEEEQLEEQAADRAIRLPAAGAIRTPTAKRKRVEASWADGTGGGSVCEHGRKRSQCRDCATNGTGGGSFCEHGRQRSQCYQCKLDAEVSVHMAEDLETQTATPARVAEMEEAFRMMLREEEPYSSHTQRAFGCTSDQRQVDGSLQRSSAPECRRMAQDIDRLDAEAANTGPHVHACGEPVRKILEPLIVSALAHREELEAASAAAPPPHEGASVGILPKTSYATLQQITVGSDLKSLSVVAVRALVDTVRQHATSGDFDVSFETQYDASLSDPGTLQPARQNRAKVVFNLSASGDGGGRSHGACLIYICRCCSGSSDLT